MTEARTRPVLRTIAIVLTLGAASVGFAQERARSGGELNRGVPQPYEPVGVWLIDQWRQIGVNVKQVVLDLHWFLTTSPVNFSRHKDTVLDDLYTRQSRATDPEERRRLLRQFEKRLYDEEVHFIMTFQWHRIVPHLAKVHGWTISPSHFLNQQLDTVWLSE